MLEQIALFQKYHWLSHSNLIKFFKFLLFFIFSFFYLRGIIFFVFGFSKEKCGVLIIIFRIFRDQSFEYLRMNSIPIN